MTTSIRFQCTLSKLLTTAIVFVTAAHAQQPGGILKMPLRENPSSASMHEET